PIPRQRTSISEPSDLQRSSAPLFPSITFPSERLMRNLLFRAEDGIRHRNVTGVQTCALPISRTHSPPTPTTSRYWTHQNGVATGPKPLRLSIPNVNTSTTCSPSTTATTPEHCSASPPGPTTTPATTPTQCCGAGATTPTW